MALQDRFGLRCGLIHIEEEPAGVTLGVQVGAVGPLRGDGDQAGEGQDGREELLFHESDWDWYCSLTSGISRRMGLRW